MRRGSTAAVIAAAGLGVLLAACQASPGQPQQAGSPPPVVSVGPSGEPGAPETGTAAPPQQATARALSPEEQARLDQELIAAAKSNNVQLVTELIGRGGSVNAKDSIQDSAFLYAGAEGFNQVLQLTLPAGADVTSINRYGGTALIPASEHGHVDTVKILIAAGVPVNHVNNPGWTAMQEAILLNDGGPRQQEVVRLLLDGGADPGIRDPEGRTALQNAERLGFAEIAALVRSRG